MQVHVLELSQKYELIDVVQEGIFIFLSGFAFPPEIKRYQSEQNSSAESGYLCGWGSYIGD